MEQKYFSSAFSDIPRTVNKYMFDKFYLLVLLKLQFNAMLFRRVGNTDMTLLHQHMLGLTIRQSNKHYSNVSLGTYLWQHKQSSEAPETM